MIGHSGFNPVRLLWGKGSGGFSPRSAARNHYEVLGVGRSADSAQIRAAYLKLIKRHHPDKKADGSSQGCTAAEINAAFAVLGNARKRAFYDTRLLLDKGWTATPVGGRLLRLSSPRKKTWRGALVAAIISAAAALWFGESGRLSFNDAFVSRGEGALEQQVPVLPVVRASASETKAFRLPTLARRELVRVEDGVQAAVRTPPRGGEAYSRSCYGKLSRQQTYAQLDHCIAFDIATTAMRPAEAGGTADGSYFETGTQSIRQKTAMRLVSNDEVFNASRRAEIEIQAIRMLVQALVSERKTSGRILTPNRSPASVGEEILAAPSVLWQPVLVQSSGGAGVEARVPGRERLGHDLFNDLGTRSPAPAAGTSRPR